MTQKKIEAEVKKVIGDYLTSYVRDMTVTPSRKLHRLYRDLISELGIRAGIRIVTDCNSYGKITRKSKKEKR